MDKVQEEHDNSLRIESLKAIVALNKKGINLGDQVVNGFGKRGTLYFSDPQLLVDFIDKVDGRTCYWSERTLKRIRA